MYPGLLIIPLFYALILAGIAIVPGLLAVAVAFATTRAASTCDEKQPGALSVLVAATHGLSRRVGAVLLAMSCGFVGAGLVSVFLNVMLMAIALLSYSNSPTAISYLDMSLMWWVYAGILGLAFLAFFAMSLDGFVKWFKPKADVFQKAQVCVRPIVLNVKRQCGTVNQEQPL